jgi:hypothetical protein
MTVSGGTRPEEEINPIAVQAMNEIGYKCFMLTIHNNTDSD